MAEDADYACPGADLDPLWYRNADTLEAEIRVHGSQHAASIAHGVAQSALSNWRKRLGLPPNQPGSKPRGGYLPDVPAGHAASVHEDADDGWLLDAIKQAGDDATVEELADHADTSPRRVRDAAARLQQRGFRIDTSTGARVTLERKPPASDHTFQASPQLLDGDVVRFAVVSDTHLGSKECRLDDLHTAYRRIADEGIREVLHPGDLVAGMDIYRHQIRDLDVIGFDAQVDFAVDHYPSEPGVTTRIVGGNHDLEGAFGKQGADPVKAVASRRPDFEHLGDYSAWIDLPNGGRIHVLHPGGGGSYAISYRAQKIAEGYEGGTKPNVTLFGHWHRRGDFTARSIQLLLCGTFEGSTSLAKRYGLGEPAVGFHIVTCRMADDGSLVEWNPRWYPFYRGRVVG